MISGIVLAAGKGTRMGELSGGHFTKQLLLLDDQTMLEHSLTSMTSSKVNEIILVLGYNYHEVLNHLKAMDTRVKIVINRQFEQGLSSSIRAGVKACAPSARGIMIALADQPFVPVEVFDLLMKRARETSKGILVPTFRGKWGHPVLFKERYRRHLLALRGDAGGLQILKAHPDDLLEVPTSVKSVVQDFDTPEDLEQLEYPRQDHAQEPVSEPLRQAGEADEA